MLRENTKSAKGLSAISLFIDLCFVTLCFVLALSSCVVSEEINRRVDGDLEFEEEISSWPIMKNVKPPFGQTEVHQDCPNWTFSILDLSTTEDGGGENDYSIRWFLDYEEAEPKIDGVGMTYTLNPQRIAAQDTEDTRHILEVIVSDMGFVEGDEGADLRTIPIGAHTDHNSWIIDFVSEPPITNPVEQCQ